MITCSRRFVFDAAHRVMGHGGKCRYLHGHRYVAEVTVKAPELDSLGMVVDFSVLKEKVGGWIDKNWDHNTILHSRDPLVRLGEDMVAGGIWKNRFAMFDDKPPYLLSGMSELANPTAENLARELFSVSHVLLPAKFQIIKVKLWETENCWAEYTPDQV